MTLQSECKKKFRKIGGGQIMKELVYQAKLELYPIGV